MAQIGSQLPSTPKMVIGRLSFRKSYADALLMPLPSDSYFRLPTRPSGQSRLPPNTKVHAWPQHISLSLAAILQFLIERNRKIDGHQLSCYYIFAEPHEDLATFLHKGFGLFSLAGQAEFFGMPPPKTPKEDNSPFNSIWDVLVYTWRYVGENDPKAPWRTNLVKNTLLNRGDFELRFYIFQNCVVEYFTIIALARTTLTDGFDVGMPFGEQEYAAWCSLMAAALLLFKGKGLEQMAILESTLVVLYEMVRGTEADVEAAVKRLLQEESRMRQLLVHLPHQRVLANYDAAYNDLAKRVTQVYNTLKPPKFSVSKAVNGL